MSAFLLQYGDILFAVILGYMAAISLTASVVTIVDKQRSRRTGARRVPENTLVLLAALGGSAAMLITMLMIRHKTRHIKFMLGLPIILLFQAVAILYVIFACG